MSLNILLIAGSDDVPANKLGEYGHKLVAASLDDFARGYSVPPETDVIVFAGMSGDKAVALWRALDDVRPPLLVLDDKVQYEAQPDLLVLPSLVPVATLESCLRLLAESRRARQKAGKLQARLERDHRQLRKTLEQFIPSHSLKDEALRWWVSNSDDIEGELLLAARTPSGELNVMAVRGGWTVFPVITPFYRMSEKGFGIEAILLEMNTRLLRLHPEGLPIGATMVSVNFQTGAARIWHAGNPSPLLLRASQNATPLVSELRSSLGASSSSFQADPWVWSLHAGDRLVLCSGGLVKALNADGWDAAAIGRLESLIASGEEKNNPLRVLPGNDDKMLVVIDCAPPHAYAVKAERKPVLSPAAAVTERWKLALTIGPDEMRKTDIVPLLLTVVEQFQSVQQQRTGQLFLILAELYNNALDHGVLQLDSRLKCGPDGMATYLEERSRRLMSLDAGSIDITLALESQGGGNLSLWVACRDSGAGFDHQMVRTQQASGEVNVLPFGRGLSLVESEASLLEFNQEGNEVRVRLSLTAPSLTVAA